jgi:hypothetical protein
MRSIQLAVALAAACSFLFGCSGGDRPAAVQSDVGSPAAAHESVASPSTEACEPGSTRTCNLHIVGEDGYRYCPQDVEVCRPDGTGYFPCGSQQILPDGGYVARDAGAD